MPRTLDIPPDLAPVQARIGAALDGVRERFEGQLRSSVAPVSRLVAHVDSYRGKMLRPTLVLAAGLAAGGGLNESHTTLGAVCEMVHMATLVHDDVLDEAGTRRTGPTINGLHGNEAAVMLGDYLIAGAYHLCSQLQSQGPALAVGKASMTLCAGELLQLAHRGDFNVDEALYYEIIRRKTAALVALSCRLGAEASGASEGVAVALESFGDKIGMAFQIQDDLLDLTGRASKMGKPVGQDLAKGKATLAVIRHLATAGPEGRRECVAMLERAAAREPGIAASIARAVQESGATEYAANVASRLIDRAREDLEVLPDSPAKRLLLTMAGAVVAREK